MAHSFYDTTHQSEEDQSYTSTVDDILHSSDEVPPENPARMMRTSGLLGMPNEVLIKIAECLPRPKLLEFGRSCRRLHHISTPVIYGTVDLSTHKRGRIAHGPLPTDKFHRQFADSFRCLDVPSKAFTKQEQFLRQVVKYPDLSKYVQKLTWTLLLLREPEWVDTGYEYPQLGKDGRRRLADRPILHIWEVFAYLTNVKKLDLAWLSHDHGHPLATAFPDALFPKASTISLSGVMEYAFVASILASNPAKIMFLNWNNVQQPKKTNFLYRDINLRQHYHRQTPARWNNLELYNGSAEAYFAAPGPMHNLLGSLAGRCPNLVGLCLTKTAERGPRHTGDTSEFTVRYSRRDFDLYLEWAHFLFHQHDRLKVLLWRQGQRDWRLQTRARQPPPAVPILLARVMDQNFSNLIFRPVLLSPGPSCLLNLQVFGVETWDGRHNTDDWVGGLLRERYGPGLRIRLNERGRVFDHIGMGVRG